MCRSYLLGDAGNGGCEIFDDGLDGATLLQGRVLARGDHILDDGLLLGGRELLVFAAKFTVVVPNILADLLLLAADLDYRPKLGEVVLEQKGVLTSVGSATFSSSKAVPRERLARLVGDREGSMYAAVDILLAPVVKVSTRVTGVEDIKRTS